MLNKVGRVSKRFSINNNPFSNTGAVQRVMSTNSWPVPYYKRMFKAYPVREQKGFDVDQMEEGMDKNYYIEV